MAGVKGAKQAKKLTGDQVAHLRKLQAQDGISIIIQRYVDEFNLSRLTFMRRAKAAGVNDKFGIKFCDLDEQTPGRNIVSLTCIECGKEYLREAYRLLDRKLRIELCGEHYVPFIVQTEEWRANNSAAQRIAQNRPEVKQKQIIAQKRRFEKGGKQLRERYRKIGRELWARPEYRAKIVRAVNKKWDDPDYRDKVFSRSKAQYHGYYKGLRYSSLLELSFILWQQSQDALVERYSGSGIRYLASDSKSRKYYPDFQIGDMIIEVKGEYWYKFHKKDVLAKHEALKKYCKSNHLKCRIVFSRDIPDYKLWCKRAREIHAENQKKDI